MRRVFLLLMLAGAVLVARAISQEIVIEPTNGRAQTANHASRPAAEKAPAEMKKTAAKSATPSGEHSAARKTAKKTSAKQVVAKAQPAPVDTQPASAPAEAPQVAPAPKKIATRPEWAMTDTRDAYSLQTEIANALARDPKLAGSEIQVKVDDDSVTMEGRAAGSEERLQAQRLAQSYAWNRKLVDHLEVVSSVTAHK